MIIHNGDHAQFEVDNANTPLKDRPDWPLPSFDENDWADAFHKHFPSVPIESAVVWFANALMRGFDEATEQQAHYHALRDEAVERVLAADGFTKYRRTQISEMTQWHPGFDMTNVSVSQADKEAGSPKVGDMIARNPKNHADKWLVAARYFADNFEPVAGVSVPIDGIRGV